MDREGFHKVGTVRRAREIASAGLRYFLFHRFNRYRDAGLGLRLRLACEELGLVFIKLGQVLSTRYDLLPRADCEELQKLLDEVPPLKLEAVRRIFAADFGTQPEALYAEFDPRPIAAASIAQVYKAKLPGGDVVAVKVKRPDVERAIRSDVRIFKFLARIAQWFSGDLQHIDLLHILDELESWLLAEVDFRHEVENLENVKRYHDARAAEADGEFTRALVFPRPFREFSSGNILTMSFMEGVSLRQFQSVAADPAYDIRASLEALMRSVLRAWITQDELFFHGDPHPSNLVLLPGGKIGLLDFGLLGRFDRQDAEETRNLFLAVFSKDVAASTRLALKMCKAPAELDTPALRADIRLYIEETEFSSLGFWFTGFMRVFIKHRIPMPYQLALFGRCQAILDGVCQAVMPGTPAIDILSEELKRGIRRRILQNISSTDLSPILYVLSEKLKESPQTVAQLIDRYADDPLRAIRDLREAVQV